MSVEFPSVESAAISNDLLVTGEITASIASIALEPPTLRNLDVVRKD
jgi:hypothetical protein